MGLVVGVRNGQDAGAWAGRGHGGGTRARWQDAGTVAGRGHGGGTRTRWQDADKQRPYYGRGLGAWGHFPRKSNGCPGRWRGHGTWPGSNAHPSTPPRQAGPRRFYANHVLTSPTPVHSRDAPCVRPAGLCASCGLMCVLPPCPRPSRLPASYAITHPTCRCASCGICHPSCPLLLPVRLPRLIIIIEVVERHP